MAISAVGGREQRTSRNTSLGGCSGRFTLLFYILNIPEPDSNAFRAYISYIVVQELPSWILPSHARAVSANLHSAVAPHVLAQRHLIDPGSHFAGDGIVHGGQRRDCSLD